MSDFIEAVGGWPVIFSSILSFAALIFALRKDIANEQLEKLNAKLQNKKMDNDQDIHEDDYGVKLYNINKAEIADLKNAVTKLSDDNRVMKGIIEEYRIRQTQLEGMLSKATINNSNYESDINKLNKQVMEIMADNKMLIKRQEELTIENSNLRLTVESLQRENIRMEQIIKSSERRN